MDEATRPAIRAVALQWQVPPLAAGAQHVEQAVQHAPHVRRARAPSGLGRRNQRLQQPPLVIRQRLASPIVPNQRAILRRPHARLYDGQTAWNVAPPVPVTPSDLAHNPFQNGLLAIAERLVGVGRLQEALQRLERATGGEHQLSSVDDARIEVLDRLGRVDDAQSVRWGVFLRTLSGTMLDAYLERTSAEARPGVTEKAIVTASGHRDVYAALSLLSNVDPDAAARLVCRRLQDISGDLDFALRPAAERLAEGHPLVAVLLRRRMVDAALARARTQSYGRVVQDLVKAEEAAVQVGDWQGFPTQDAYREVITRQHRAKTAFWARMNAVGLLWRA